MTLADEVRAYLRIAERSPYSFQRDGELVSEAIQPLWEERKNVALQRARQALWVALGREECELADLRAGLAKTCAQRDELRAELHRLTIVDANFVGRRMHETMLAELRAALAQYANRENWSRSEFCCDACIFLPDGQGWEIAAKALKGVGVAGGASATKDDCPVKPEEKSDGERT